LLRTSHGLFDFSEVTKHPLMFFSPSLHVAQGGCTCVTTVVGCTTWNRPLQFFCFLIYLSVVLWTPWICWHKFILHP